MSTNHRRNDKAISFGTPLATPFPACGEALTFAVAARLLLPPPLWGRVGVGGREVVAMLCHFSRPPPPSPQRGGEELAAPPQRKLTPMEGREGRPPEQLSKGPASGER